MPRPLIALGFFVLSLPFEFVHVGGQMVDISPMNAVNELFYRIYRDVKTQRNGGIFNALEMKAGDALIENQRLRPMPH